MSKYILDASALLALLNSEEGAKEVEKVLSSSVMSTVNVAEVIAELDRKLNISAIEGKEMIETAIDKILPLDFAQAIEAGRLRKSTEEFGFSLGDRSCIALGITTGYTIYTADRAWAKLRTNCKIIIIR